MIKELTNGEIRTMGFGLANAWGNSKNDIHVSGKNLFNLLKIKAEIDAKMEVINKAFLTVGEQNGGTINEQGNMQIPTENLPKVNKELDDIANQTDEIEYNEIVLTDGETMPVDLMEIFLPFISFE